MRNPCEEEDKRVEAAGEFYDGDRDNDNATDHTIAAPHGGGGPASISAMAGSGTINAKNDGPQEESSR